MLISIIVLTVNFTAMLMCSFNSMYIIRCILYTNKTKQLFFPGFFLKTRCLTNSHHISKTYTFNIKCIFMDIEINKHENDQTHKTDKQTVNTTFIKY